MIEVKHIHRNGNLETRETLDLSRCKNCDYVDKVTIGEEGRHIFVVTMEDFEEIYKKKLDRIKENRIPSCIL